jgi:hypothetical protein
MPVKPFAPGTYRIQKAADSENATISPGAETGCFNEIVLAGFTESAIFTAW